MSHKVFISVGRTFTAEQEQFVQAFEEFLRVQGLTPETVGRTYVRNQQPLRSVAECMKGCSGLVVLAFERVFIAEGAEKRGSSEEAGIHNSAIPTVWNQIEAAMAYTLGIPLLVIVQNGLRSEGLLEKGYDWYVKSVHLSPATLADRELVGLVADWKARIEERSQELQKALLKSPDQNIEKMTVGKLLASLEPGQLWAVLVALFTVISAVATVAFKLGSP